jgi:hypothetical protein
LDALQVGDLVAHGDGGGFEEAQAGEAGLRLLYFYERLKLHELKGAADAADLLVELGAGRTRTKMTTTTDDFHAHRLLVITQIYLSVNK